MQSYVIDFLHSSKCTVFIGSLFFRLKCYTCLITCLCLFLTATEFAKQMGFTEESLQTNRSRDEWINWQNNNCQPNYRQVCQSNNCQPNYRQVCQSNNCQSNNCQPSYRQVCQSNNCQSNNCQPSYRQVCQSNNCQSNNCQPSYRQVCQSIVVNVVFREVIMG